MRNTHDDYLMCCECRESRTFTQRHRGHERTLRVLGPFEVRRDRWIEDSSRSTGDGVFCGNQTCAARVDPDLAEYHLGPLDDHPMAPDDHRGGTSVIEHALIDGIPGALIHREVVPARSATHGTVPVGLHPSVVECLPLAIYSNQAEALRNYLAGSDVFQTTGTGSGKSLGLVAPALDALMKDANSTAIALYPTRALARDQLNSLRGWGVVVDDWGSGFELSFGADHPTIEVALDHSDVEVAGRRRARRSARLLLTTPDQLHQTYLPSARKDDRLLRNLRLLIIDEAHSYTGELGALLASLLRRIEITTSELGFHRPQILMASATVHHPAALFEALTGRADVAVVDNDGSPQHEFTLLVADTSNLTAGGASSSDLDVDLIESLTRAHGGSPPNGLIFFESKQRLRNVKDSAERRLRSTGYRSAANAVGSYTGSSSADERNRAEQRIQSGEQRLTLTTSALELGVDLHPVRFVVTRCEGLTQAELRQRLGRAGRGGPGIALVITGSMTVGQWKIDCAQVKEMILGSMRPMPLPQLTSEAVQSVLIEGVMADLGTVPEAVYAFTTAEQVHALVGNPHGSTSTPAGPITLRSFRPHSTQYAVVTERNYDEPITTLTAEEAIKISWSGAVHTDDQGIRYEVVRCDPKHRRILVRPCSQDLDSRASVQTEIQICGEQDSFLHGRVTVSKVEATLAFHRTKAERWDDDNGWKPSLPTGSRTLSTGTRSITIVDVPLLAGVAPLDDLGVLLQSCLDAIGIGRYQVFSTVVEGRVCLYGTADGSPTAWTIADRFVDLIETARTRLFEQGGLTTHNGWVSADRFLPLLSLMASSSIGLAA